MFGLCLPGGGAKGAFSAGVVYGLYEKGTSFDILSGTSIGAINGYFIYTGNMEKLKEIWTTMDEKQLKKERYFGKVIENEMLIDNLRKLEEKDTKIKSFYVNYVHIENKELKEKIVELSKYEKIKKLEYIQYSSLLPCRMKEETSMKEIIEGFDSKVVFEAFKEDVEKGVYEGYNLDGGILNNNLLHPFIKNKVNKLFIVPLRKNYSLPEYILEHYSKEEITLIEPSREMEPKDTLRFEREFCKELFYEGYEMSKKIKREE